MGRPRRTTCHPNFIHYRGGLCRLCWDRAHKEEVNGLTRQLRLKNPERERFYGIKNRYSLTKEFVLAAFNSQKGRCAVCDDMMKWSARKGDPKTVCIDHDHRCCNSRTSCGECFRGLICGDCNIGMGRLHDDPIIMLRAIEYLLKISFQEGT